MSSFRRRMLEGPTLLLDGGLGSMLIARDLPPGAPPDRWNLERPDTVLEVHRAYAEAGSEAIHSNTFGANPARLSRFDLSDRCAEINAAGISLARAAGARYVIGDVGPTGELLPPLGQGDPAAWSAGYRLQGRALREAGADALHVETVSDLREALLILEALLAVASDLPILVSLTFDRKKRGFFTIMGDALIRSLQALAAAGAAGVGANCTLQSPDMGILAREALAVVQTPLVVQPNAGMPEVHSGGIRYLQRPDEFASDMAPLAAEGVAALGGCCGTDPRFIAALRGRLDDKPPLAGRAARGDLS